MEGVAPGQVSPEGGSGRWREEESLHRAENRREREPLGVEGGTGETEAEGPRGSLLKAAEEGGKETCPQDMERKERGEKGQQAERPAPSPASSPSRLPPWTY